MMTTFQWLVRLRILSNVAVALVMVCWPRFFVETLGFKDPGQNWSETELAWVQALGIAVLLLTHLYVPSALMPHRVSLSNLVVVLAPIIPVALLIWLAIKTGFENGFVWFALYELVFFVAIAWVLRRDWMAVIQSKP